MIFDTPNPSDMIRNIILGTGGIGGGSATLLMVFFVGVLLRPMFILLGISFDNRRRSRTVYRPWILISIGAIILVVGPMIITRPMLFKSYLYKTIEIPISIRFWTNDQATLTLDLPAALGSSSGMAYCPLPRDFAHLCSAPAPEAAERDPNEGSTFAPDPSRLPQIGQ